MADQTEPKTAWDDDSNVQTATLTTSGSKLARDQNSKAKGLEILGGASYSWGTIARSFLSLFDLHVLVVLVLAEVSTFVFLTLELTCQMDFIIVLVALVFPVIGLLTECGIRRAGLFASFAALKSNLLTIQTVKELGEPEARAELRSGLRRYFAAVKSYCKSTDKDTRALDVREVYSAQAALFKLNNKYPTEQIWGTIQINGLGSTFEAIRQVREFRTSLVHNAYASIWLNLAPFLMGPMFADLSRGSNAYDQPNTWVGFYVAFLYAVVFTTLDNCKDKLEDPLDGDSVDDFDTALAQAELDDLLDNVQ